MESRMTIVAMLVTAAVFGLFTQFECYKCQGKCGDAMTEDSCTVDESYCFRGWKYFHVKDDPRPVKGCVYEVDVCPEHTFNCTFCYSNLCNRSRAGETCILDPFLLVVLVVISIGILFMKHS